MRLRRRLLGSMLAVTFLAPLAAPAQAGFKYCFQLEGSREPYCFEIPVLVHRFDDIIPDPGPLRAIDISRIAPELHELVGKEAKSVVITDGLGERTILVDLEAQVAFDVQQNAGP